ncbi:hypothetical protein TRVL_06339 [Trypanosoma vivax]|nr:hypothetical protein TRVL_06339 [Trypanosoma vivax]
MAERPGVRTKRGLSPSEEDVQNTSLYADSDTMAQRRIVRVRRSPPRYAPESLCGAFKAVSGVAPAGAPALTTKFGSLSGGAVGSDAGACGTVVPVSQFPSLGNTMNKCTESCGSFSFQATAPGGDSVALKKPRSDPGSVEDDKGTRVEATFSNGAGNNGDSAGTSLFGPSFNFCSAASSFAEAKERMMKMVKESKDEEPVSASASTPSNKTNNLSTTVSVVASTGDVLASVPAKLYILKADTKSWSECGVGEARVKRHEFPSGEGTTSGSPRYRYRLIVRDGYALNALLCDGFHLTKAEGTHAIFSVATGEKITTYLLKYTGQQAAERGPIFSKTLIDSLKLAQGGEE